MNINEPLSAMAEKSKLTKKDSDTSLEALATAVEDALKDALN